MEFSLPNEQVEVYKMVDIYKPFLGRNIDQMPLLLGEGRSPVWAARFMRRRIDHSDALSDLKGYLDVSDLVAYDSRKRSTGVKFILTVNKNGRVTENGGKALGLINPDIRLTSDYAAPLNELYDELDGVVAPRSEMGAMGRDLSEKEILESRAWRILARHPDEVPAEFAEDKNLLKEYSGWVMGQTKEKENMGIYFDSNSDVAKLRAVCVNGLDVRSGLVGRVSLHLDVGRLVGFLASETPSAPAEEGGVVRAYTEVDVDLANEQLAELERFVRPESLGKVRSLVGKLASQ